MKQQAAWGAAIVVAIGAAIGVSSQPGGKHSEPASPPASQNRAAASISTSKNALSASPCSEIEEHLLSFFALDDSSTAAPLSCFDTKAQSAAVNAHASPLQGRLANVNIVIATLPDPLHTHFPLVFDRAAEAIQQGATDEGYLYDSSWMPWETHDDTFSRLDDQDKQDDRKKAREDQPGILLFRRDGAHLADCQATAQPKSTIDPFSCALLVFVVGEEPTGGIHRGQFIHALDWIAALHPKPSRMPKILGPFFSGSLPSLWQLLSTQSAHLPRLPPTTPGSRMQIYSGEVSNSSAVARFVNQTWSPGLTFKSFQESDEVVVDRFCRHLLHQRFDLHSLAIVSEDETAYGKANVSPAVKDEAPDQSAKTSPSTNPTPCDLLATRLYYPRDISALRAAYQAQSIFSSAPAASSADPTLRTLSDDLADPAGEEHDTIRNYSGMQTALSQEAELQQIVTMLRVHHSQYIVLRSSNPLDQLFLSHYLRLAYPEGRIVMLGADLLLRREGGAASLNGIMTLSTYPLLPWGADWTRFPLPGDITHDHRVFAQNGDEGSYVATRFLLGSHAAAYPDTRCFLPVDAAPSSNLPNYAPPIWAIDIHSPPQIRRPSVWLSVLGRDGFWPLAALDGNTPFVPPVYQPLSKYSVDPVPAVYSENCASDAADLPKVPASAPPTQPPLQMRLPQTPIRNLLPRLSAQPWPELPLSLKVTLGCIFCWAVFHLSCCCWPSVTFKPGFRAHFVRPVKGWYQPALVVLASAAIVSAQTVVALGYGFMSSEGEPLNNAWFYRLLLPLVWSLAGLGILVNVWRRFQSSREPASSAAAPPPSTPVELPIASRRKPAQSRSAKIAKEITHLSQTPGSKWRSAKAKAKAARGILQKNWLQFLLPAVAFAALTFIFYAILDHWLEGILTSEDRIPTYWRSMNVTSGVSPAVPFLALAMGLYLWCWYSLQGLSLFGEGHPVLPKMESLRIDRGAWFCPYAKETAEDPIEQKCSPFAPFFLWRVLGLFAVLFLLSLWLSGGAPILSLGHRNYSRIFCTLLGIGIAIILATAWQLLQIWLGLHQLLLALERLRLRRTMQAFKLISWGSVWRMSGNVLDLRYKLLVNQIECLTHLRNTLPESFHPDPQTSSDAEWRKEISTAMEKVEKRRGEFADWIARHYDDSHVYDQTALQNLQDDFAHLAGKLMSKPLILAWRNEHESLLTTSPDSGDASTGKDKPAASDYKPSALPYVHNAEEFVCSVYLGFIQNILGRIRSLVMALLWMFVAATLSVSTYPFDPRPVVSATMVILFLAIGTAVVIVYSQMYRNTILSLVTDTKPGELGSEFWIKLVSFGAGPAIGLIATLFPQLTESLFSWIQPGIDSIK
jgi:hypothetical protein